MLIRGEKLRLERITAMPRPEDPMERLRIAAPCRAAWEEMAGDARVRHCTLCSLNVYNFAEMTRDEVRELLVRTEGRVCARLYRRADGTVLTRNCPTGLQALRKRATRIATAAAAALFNLSAMAFGGTTCEKPRLDKHGAKVKIEVERVAAPLPAVFTGVVRDEAGDLLPGVDITVRDETTKRELKAVTDGKGAFTVGALSDGLYRVEVALEGFQPTLMEHLELKASEVTRASVELRLGATTGVITMSAEPVAMSEPMSITFSQDFINKLPL
jgi:hypothetical protein